MAAISKSGFNTAHSPTNGSRIWKLLNDVTWSSEFGRPFSELHLQKIAAKRAQNIILFRSSRTLPSEHFAAAFHWFYLVPIIFESK